MKILSCIFIFLFPQYVFAAKVLMVTPEKQDWVFWKIVNQVSLSSAKSLGIELEVVSGGVDRFATLEIIKSITSRTVKPDYIIFRPYHGNAVSVFDKIEASGISFVTLEQPIFGNEAIELQKPKQKYKHWIGEVSYDNVKGGEDLLEALLDEHAALSPNVPPSIIGIGGSFDNLSLSRQHALTNLEISHDERLNQIFPTYWNANNVTENFELMMRRYPESNLFWCASDQLALEVLKQYQQRYDQSPIVGGFDWLPEALENIRKGKLTASMGGHFLMGAIAITKIFDYEHGIDRFRSPPQPYDFEIVTKHNVVSHLNFMQQKKWQDVDFNKFSYFKTGQEPIKLTIKNMIEANQ